MGQTISLLNMKGGVGKTTLAVNLAYYMYRHRRQNVLLVDLDPQFNASQYVMTYKTYEAHVRDNGTIADLLIESPTLRLKGKHKRPSINKCIAQVQKSKDAVFNFLPSQLALSHVVKNPHQMEFKLERLLQPIRKHYDYIFIDCAPTDSVLTTMSLTASEFVLVPMRPDRFSILGFANLIETIEAFKENSQDPHNVRELGIVFTQVRNESGPQSECMDSVRAEATARDFYVFDSELGWSNTFTTAVQNQTPAFETKYARDELKANITEIVAEMESRIDELTDAEE